MKFKVQVTRVRKDTTTFEVDANSTHNAKAKALVKIKTLGPEYFNTGSTSFEVTDVYRPESRA